ncbi:MAG TPA: ketol-acid reductoisomerase [Gammaproteobacteria bacterium]|jgi:ketol-acid reductoisomerase|nr:ketol-acid reductoisomerase [Gammaproteobacteria bacterium]HJP42018.1 ketol-acid reductoisomerase [Gammaproteobacteria bacterium]
MKIFSKDDVNQNQLQSKKVTILGYGSQGRAHAMNLKDSGLNVVVGLRQDGSSWSKAIADGLVVKTIEEAVSDSDLIAFLVPDMAQPQIYQSIESGIKNSATILFAHGFNIHYNQIEPREDLDVILIAPKSPGDLVRREYKQGKGVPCLMAVYKDNSGQAEADAMAYAHGIGGSRAGILSTTFAEETETDLFGEQAVLCGGCTELIIAGFDTLVEAGYQPEVAYFECMHELKLIVDLMYEGGIAKMHEFVSETAIYGDLSRGPRVINAETRERMKTILLEIQNSTFSNEWIEENKSGKENYNQMMADDLNHPIEKVGSELRKRMSWLNK